MKTHDYFLFSILTGLLISSACQTKTQDNSQIDQLKSRLTVLEKRVEDTKPSLSGIMSGIQRHHTKLYYAGVRQNWSLAEYELGEIKEGIERSTKSYPNAMTDSNVMETAVSDMSQKITQRNGQGFIPEFTKMTLTCNRCHSSHAHDFIAIEIPGPGMFTDQKFRQ